MHTVNTQLTDAELETLRTLILTELNQINEASQMVRVTALEKRMYGLISVQLNDISQKLGL